MALQSYRYDPAQKYFYVNQDFSGGMNTSDADAVMDENQMRLIENMELTTRGSLVKRDGFSRYASMTALGVEGEFQGHFRYFKTLEDNELEMVEFFAKNGSIFELDSSTNTLIPVTYLPIEATEQVALEGLQTTRMMNSLVYDDIMIVATGSFLLEYGLFDDPESNPVTQSYYFREMDPYKPTALEYANVGANLLSDDPYNFLADGTASILVNEGIVTKNRTATLNIEEELITYLSRPSGVGVSIKWEVRKSDETEWTDINGGWKAIDFNTLANKKLNYTFPSEGDYTIRSSITLTTNLNGQTLTDSVAVYVYVLSGFEVTPIEDIEKDKPYTPQLCNFLLLYFDQIIMWGDPSVPNAVYISDVFKPSYMPSDNVLLLETPQEDSVTAIVYYMEVLVIFTDNNTFALLGKTPAQFSIKPINRTIGCVAPYSAVAVSNYVIFLSREGIYKLKTLSTINTTDFNVEKIDLDIWTTIPKTIDRNANAIQSGLVYMLTFPASKIRIKWYYQQDVWAIDRSLVFDYKYSTNVNGVSLAYRPNGIVLRQDATVYNDDGLAIKCMVETKDAHLGFPFHPKKFKAVKLNFMNDPEIPSEAFMTVAVDSALVVNPAQDRVFINDDNEVVWEYSKLSNIQLFSGSKFGSWVLSQSKLGVVNTTIIKYPLTGKGYNVKIRIEHEDNTDFGLLGYSLVFKIKKP